LRGELNVDHLVVQGLELGQGVFIGRRVYLDTGHPWLISGLTDESKRPQRDAPADGESRYLT
jgi:hypothetical protein